MIRTTESNPIIERAATIGRRESDVWVFVGSAVGTSVGETGVVCVIVGNAVGTVVWVLVIVGSVAVARAR